MNFFEEITHILAGKVTKETILDVCVALGAEYVDSKPGNYDEGTDGWNVIKFKGSYYKLTFYDDSYDSGYFESIERVVGKEKTITVWKKV